MRLFLLFVLFAYMTKPGLAQNYTYDFGDVPREQLEKEVYEIDSTANAVVLFDVGETYLDNRLRLHYKRHTRIKVLTDEGLEEGNVSIGFRTEEPEQRVTDLKVVSYNLRSDGKVEDHKLGRRDKYFEEITDSWTQLKFSVPGLQRGSVFEYQYDILSDSPFDYKDWRFQRDIPVLWSSYSAKIPEWFTYLTFTKGYYPLVIKNQTPYSDRILSGSLRNISYSGRKYEWAMKDLPAINEEPYIKSVEDYASALKLQISKVKYPNTRVYHILTNWGDMMNLLNESDSFGGKLRSNSTFKKIIQEELSGDLTDHEKVVQLYDLVREKMVWDERFALYVGDDLESLYKTGNGNGSEINMILVQLLRDAGLYANPVILSTRSNGMILDVFPVADQFNHTLAYVITDSTSYLLDAIHKNRPYDLLPVSSLNGSGLVVRKGLPDWVDLENSERASENHLVYLNLRDDGSYTATLESSYSGYYSFSEREKVMEVSDKKKAVHELLFDGDSDISIDSVSVSEGEENPFTLKAEFKRQSLENNAQILYFNPMITGGMNANPFKEEERKYPVDFRFPFKKGLVLNVNLPKGWEIEELPQSKLVRLPEQIGEFKKIIQPNDLGFMMIYSFQINKRQVSPEQYDYLRQTYQMLVESSAENVVLKKKGEQ